MFVDGLSARTVAQFSMADTNLHISRLIKQLSTNFSRNGRENGVSARLMVWERLSNF